MTPGLVREAMHFERPVSPLFATLVLPAVAHGFTRASRTVGGGPGALELHAVDGYVYAAWTSDAGPLPPTPEDVPTLGELAKAWREERVPETRARIEELRAMVRPGVSALRAAAELERVPGLLESLYEALYHATFTTQSGWTMLEGALARAGDPAPHLTVATLVSPCLSLLHDVDAWLARHAGASTQTLAADPFWSEVRDRPAWPDLLAPTWGEDPTLARRSAALATSADFAAGLARAQNEQARAFDTLTARFPPDMRTVLEDVVAMVRDAREVTQTLNYLVGEVALGATRGLALRAGSVLATQHLVDDAEDALFLEAHELVASLRDGASARGLVPARRKAHEAALATTPPDILGDVDPRVLDDPALAAMLGVRAPARADAPMRGLAASAGSATGPARVVLTDDDVANVRPGEVVVVRMLPPSWTPVVGRAAAIVAEMGGILSHAAIVAREYGRPAVVGVPEATRRIRSGEEVTVDGASGDVRTGKRE